MQEVFVIIEWEAFSGIAFKTVQAHRFIRILSCLIEHYCFIYCTFNYQNLLKVSHKIKLGIELIRLVIVHWI